MITLLIKQTHTQESSNMDDDNGSNTEQTENTFRNKTYTLKQKKKKAQNPVK